MDTIKVNPRYNVISMRISEEEREYIEKIMMKTNKSVSDIMREALMRFDGDGPDRGASPVLANSGSSVAAPRAPFERSAARQAGPEGRRHSE